MSTKTKTPGPTQQRQTRQQQILNKEDYNMNATAETTKYLCGEIYVDVLTGPDCDGGREVRKISDVSFAMQVGGMGFSMSLKGFSDSSGKTIEQALTEHGEELKAIIEMQDVLEASE